MKKIFVFILTLAIVCNVAGVSSRELFTDVPEDSWAADYIYNLVDRGIVGGYGDGTFGPESYVLRCEYAKMLVNIAGIEIVNSATTPYNDVAVNEWYFPFITSATPMTGYSIDGHLYFKPEDAATREDVTVAMVKALGVDVSQYSDPTGYLAARFSDWEEISTHNRAYITAAVDKGVITGDMSYDGGLGTFRPHDPIIRAEIVAVLYRAFPDGNNVQANPL